MPRYFAGHLAPWNAAVVGDARRWWRGAGETPIGRLLQCWWIVVLAVFSLSAGQRSVYLLPLFPPLALLAARSLTRHVSSRRTWYAVAAVLVVTSCAMLALSTRKRLAESAGRPLAPLARATAALVPQAAALYASRGLSENDALVLAYLLDRPLARRRVVCDGGVAASYYLRPVPSGTAATPLDRLAVSGDLELGRCPLE
jgi:4-amino-4-deoxy-L-arabinose transferase-like glycosyltransferase